MFQEEGVFLFCTYSIRYIMLTMNELEIQKKYFPRLLIIVGLYALIANFVHPVSPAFYQSLNLPDFMFGVAFACMMTTNFLFSPFWGNISKRIGPSRIVVICLFGYAIGQFFFMMSKNSFHLAFARLFAGIFTGGMEVGFILYNIEHSSEEERGTHLALAATVTAVLTAFGFMIGGTIGDISIRLDMMVQIISLFSLSLLTFFLLKDHQVEKIENQTLKEALKESNPLASFMKAKGIITGGIILFLLLALFMNFGTTAYDQSFNYYIRDQFGFPPSYNGLLKGIVGLITLFMNSTVCVYLLRKTNIYHSIIYVILILCLMLMGITQINAIVPFIILNVIFFGFTAIYKPLLQSMVSDQDQKNAGLLVGVYQSMIAIGSVFGALVSGFLYKEGPKYPFICSLVVFMIAMVFAILLYRNRKEKQNERN